MHTLEYDPFYEAYISRYKGDCMPDALEKQLTELENLVGVLPESKADFAYAPGKWSIARLLLHIADAERIFSYRAFCISRGETQNLNGMDQDIYAANSNSESRSLSGILSEFRYVRKSSIALFQSMSEEQWSRNGTANQARINVRALGCIIYGHCDHHMEVLTTRYVLME